MKSRFLPPPKTSPGRNPTMKKMLAASLAGLSMILAAGAALAADAPKVETTTIEDLAANPATKAILDKDVPMLTSHPAFDQFKAMTLKALQPLSQGALTDEILATVQADLDKLPKP
jgi:hypothetical protein